ASPVRPTADDVRGILDHWRRRLTGSYLLDARHALRAGDGARARRDLGTIIAGGPPVGVGYWGPALALRRLHTPPIGAAEGQRAEEGTEIVDAVESWGEALRRLGGSAR